MTTQEDERKVIRCSDVGLATSKPHVNLSKTPCLELDNFILKFEVTTKKKTKKKSLLTSQGKKLTKQTASQK